MKPASALKLTRSTTGGSLARAILIAGVALVLLTTAAIVIPQYWDSRKALNGHVREMLTDNTEETRKRMDHFLVDVEKMAELGGTLLNSGLIDVGDDTAVDSYFRDFLNVMPVVDGMYVGRADGSFVFSKRIPKDDKGATRVTKVIEFVRGEKRVFRIWRDDDGRQVRYENVQEDAYDPRERAWYRAARDSDRRVWTDPYAFFSSQLPGITVSSRIVDKSGKTRAVFGMDVDLKPVSEFLREIQPRDGGYAVVVDENGRVIAHTNADRLGRPQVRGSVGLAYWNEMDLVTTAAVEAAPARMDFSKQISSTYEYTYMNEDWSAVFQGFSDTNRFPWTVGVFAKRDAYTGSIRDLSIGGTYRALLIGGLMTIFSLLFAPYLLERLQSLHQRASLDSLTGLLNRRSFEELASVQFAKSVNDKGTIAAIMLDIDYFKSVNDNNGHQVGDEVLVAVARRLAKALSDRDILSRYGGEEFAVILPDANLIQAVRVARRLHEVIREDPIETHNVTVPVTVSLGVASISASVATVRELLDEADQRLLIAKRTGRDRIAHDDIDSQLSVIALKT